MKNKVLVCIGIPEINKKYDVYLPVNKKIGNIIELLNKAINELTDNEFIISNQCLLYNVVTKEKYTSDVLLINTNIRNGSHLILLSK